MLNLTASEFLPQNSPSALTSTPTLQDGNEDKATMAVCYIVDAAATLDVYPIRTDVSSAAE